jgi:hypothetical protein
LVPPSSASTIQPASQPSGLSQVAPPDDAHIVTVTLRLIASLRASCVLATMSLAKPESLLLNDASRNEGTASPTRIAMMTIAVIISITVKPRALRPGGFTRRVALRQTCMRFFP